MEAQILLCSKRHFLNQGSRPSRFHFQQTLSAFAFRERFAYFIMQAAIALGLNVCLRRNTAPAMRQIRFLFPHLQ